jgi:hypothetical protein
VTAHLIVGVVIAVHVMAFCGYYSCRWGMLTLGKRIAKDGLDLDVIVGTFGLIVGSYLLWRHLRWEATVLLGVAGGVFLWQVVQRAQMAGAKATPKPAVTIDEDDHGPRLN